MSATAASNVVAPSGSPLEDPLSTSDRLRPRSIQYSARDRLGARRLRLRPGGAIEFRTLQDRSAELWDITGLDAGSWDCRRTSGCTAV